jgi:cAMP phosphodiesterase
MKDSEFFKVIVLGCTGGPKEGNMSSYLLGIPHTKDYITLDAGTLLEGLEKAYLLDHFEDLDVPLTDNPIRILFLKHIKAYLISHPHLDHIAGLVINSQIDISKPLLGSHFTINSLRDYIFNGSIWPNYGSEGVEPILNIYNYIRLGYEEPPTPIPGTQFNVEAFVLSHPKDYPSTAFLIEYQGEYVLYFGDTSSDFMEEKKHLSKVWKRVAPIIRKKKLRGMFLECSFSMERENQAMYGHLNPKLLAQEMDQLEKICGCSLAGLKMIVTHRKDCFEIGLDMKHLIAQQITNQCSKGIIYIFPEQGDKIYL